MTEEKKMAKDINYSGVKELEIHGEMRIALYKCDQEQSHSPRDGPISGDRSGEAIGPVIA